MGRTTGSAPAEASESLKAVLSSVCSLQLDCTKLGSLVIADQHAAGNTFAGLVHAARHTREVGNAETRWPKLREGAV